MTDLTLSSNRFIMIVPVGWAIVCYAAVIAYGARSRAFAAITAACSGVVSTILAVDFWLSHRTTHRAPDFKPHALSVVYVKLAGAVLLFAASLAISIYFAATKTPDGDNQYCCVQLCYCNFFFFLADLVWTSIAALMSLIWILDLIVLQRKASLEVV
jgi:hypothetical protein